MPRIREDLVGVVSVGGLNLLPGDVVPDGVLVGGHVLAAEPEREPAPKCDAKPAARKPRPRKSEE